MLNMKSATISIANILASDNSNIKQVGMVIFLNNLYNSLEHYNNTEHTINPTAFKISRDGDLFINGTKLDPENLPLGCKFVIDKKEAHS